MFAFKDIIGQFWSNFLSLKFTDVVSHVTAKYLFHNDKTVIQSLKSKNISDKFRISIQISITLKNVWLCKLVQFIHPYGEQFLCIPEDPNGILIQWRRNIEGFTVVFVCISVKKSILETFFFLFIHIESQKQQS